MQTLTRLASPSDKKRSNIERLPLVAGASYNELLGCMVSTRSAIIDQAVTFLNCKSVGDARILLLSGCAGSGKTAVAHSVAEICEREHHSLGSSFFFEASQNLRDSPQQLITTLARELSARNFVYASHLSEAIEANPGIITAPLANQFQTLLLHPSIAASQDSQPTAVVIDGIDEGWSEELLRVIKLCSKLPSWIRLFMTVRDDGSILPRLQSQSHIHSLEIDITTDGNLADIELYVEERLHATATTRNIEHWPTPEVLKRMCEKAAGLFIWAAVACNSIDDIDVDPIKQYTELVSDGRITYSRAFSQMDELYMKVLLKCRLHETLALSRYHQCIGAMLALRRPLSTKGIATLLDERHIHFTLRPFTPVIQGPIGLNHLQPIQIIHQSFREFVTKENTDASFPDYTIVEAEHSEALALRCLALIRKEMPSLSYYTGWITDNWNESRREPESSIPVLAEGIVSEALWYACEYVGEHIDKISQTVSRISHDLIQFMREDLYGWLAVCAMKGNCRDLENMHNYLQVRTV